MNVGSPRRTNRRYDLNVCRPDDIGASGRTRVLERNNTEGVRRPDPANRNARFEMKRRSTDKTDFTVIYSRVSTLVGKTFGDRIVKRRTLLFRRPETVRRKPNRRSSGLYIASVERDRKNRVYRTPVFIFLRDRKIRFSIFSIPK